MTLTQRLFVLTAVALTPAFLILLYNVVALRESREKEIHATALQSGQIAALEMERIVYGAEDVLKAIASAPEVRDLAEPRCSEYLRAVDAQIQKFRAIRVVDTTGRFLCSSEEELPKVSIGDRPYIAEALATGAFVVGTYTVDRIDGHKVLPLALPWAGQNGQIDRVLVGTLDLGWLGGRLRERTYAKDNALTIADRDGVIIAREPQPERFVGTRIPDAFQPLVRGEKPGSMEVMSQDGTRRVIGYKPATVPPVGLYVSAGIGSDDAFAPIDEAATRGLVMAAVGVVLAVLATWLTGRALVRRPVGQLLATIESWRSGDERARTGMTETEGEIGTVGKAIDGYMDELVADRQLRREAEEHRELLLRELDHRVKNILATVQAVARQTFREGVDPADAMNAYTARLTAIAGAHSLLVSNSWRSADLEDVLAAAAAPFRREQDARFVLAGPPLTVEAKTALALSMAVHELCTNSVKYGALGSDTGRVRLTWRVEDDESGQLFRLEWCEENGPPVSEPTRKGFGSRMIERLLAAELGARISLEYPPTGLRCRVEAPLAAVVVSDTPRAAPVVTEDKPDDGVTAAPALGSA